MSIRALAQIQGRETNGNMAEEASRKVLSETSRYYSAAAFAIANSTTNALLSDNDTDFFTELQGACNFIEIYTDQAITIRCRTKAYPTIADRAIADLPPITLTANARRTINFIADIIEIYISNASGSSANINIVGI